MKVCPLLLAPAAALALTWETCDVANILALSQWGACEEASTRCELDYDCYACATGAQDADCSTYDKYYAVCEGERRRLDADGQADGEAVDEMLRRVRTSAEHSHPHAQDRARSWAAQRREELPELPPRERVPVQASAEAPPRRRAQAAQEARRTEGEEGECHHSCATCDGSGWMDCLTCADGWTAVGDDTGLCTFDWVCEVTVMDVPVNSSLGASSEQMDFSFRRIRSTANASDEQDHVWLLQGGPGSSGEGVIFTGLYYNWMVGNVQALIPDHRGLGKSTFTECDIGEAASVGEYATACLSDLEDGDDALPWAVAQHMTITDAAADLVAGIAAALDDPATTAEDADPAVIVHGFSYGSAWAHRAVELDGEGEGLIDGYVLDGVVAQGFDPFNFFAAGSNRSGATLMEYCALDATCSEYYESEGGGTWAGLGELQAQLAVVDNDCEAYLLGYASSEADNLETIKILLYYAQVFGREFTTEGVVDFRGYFLAWLHLAASCADEAEESAFQTFLGFVLDALADDDTATDDETLQSWSSVVYYGIVYSDLWGTPSASLTDNAESYETILFGSDSFVDFKSGETWISYLDLQHDEWYGTFADTPDAGVLLVNGDLDGQTPVSSAELMHDGITAGANTLGVISGAGHAVALRDPCGIEMLQQFLADPLAELDTSCTVDEISQVNFEGIFANNVYFFGDPNIWAPGTVDDVDDDDDDDDDDDGALVIGLSVGGAVLVGGLVALLMRRRAQDRVPAAGLALRPVGQV